MAGQHSNIDHTGLTGVGVGDATAHIADATDAHDASAVSVVPAGGLAATNVQAALEELDADITGGGNVVTYDVQRFDTAGNATWTKPANAAVIDVWCLGAGGSGGSGRKGAASSARYGGSGGGPGGMSHAQFLDSDLGATEKLTVGAGQTGGALVSASDTDGNVGVQGGSSYFGNTVDGTIGDATVVGAGGGAGSAGNATSSAGARAGLGAVASANYLTPDATMLPGFEAGGRSLLTGSALSAFGGFAAGGGGGGGAVDASNNERAGGTGGYPAQQAGTTGGGSAGAVHAAGGNGAAGQTSSFPTGGYGGGGGGGSKTAANLGTGGNGGAPGGGGGGGGAGVNAVVNSGAGGTSAAGAVWVITTCIA